MGLCLGAQPQPVAQAAPVAEQKKLSQPELPVQAEALQPRIYVLCLHDVGKPHGVSMTTSPAHVNDYITKLKKDGYTFLSLADYVAMSKLERPVPAKAVMLSFDDGYESFYKEIFPILKKQHVPAMMGIIGSWMDNGAGSGIKMSTWDQFKEMEASGLVTIACHSYDLHKPVPVNDLGEQSQAVGSRMYRNGRYENEREYEERIAFDFQKAQAQLKEKLGHTAEAYVWPFGVYTEKALELGRQAGFTYFFQLSDGYNTPIQQNLDNGNSLLRARRIMVYGNLPASRIEAFLRSYSSKNRNPIPFVTANVSDLYVPNNESQTLNNIDQFLDRFDADPDSVVVLNLAADTNGNGIPDSVYFYNDSGIPVVKNIAAHIQGRINAKGYRVYGYIPQMEQWGGTSYGAMNAAQLQSVQNLYHDMAVYLPDNGLYFDRAFLNENQTGAAYSRTVQLIDELRTDNMAIRSTNNRALAAVPDAFVLRPQQMLELLHHVNYLQVSIEPGKAGFDQWKHTPAARLPRNKKLLEGLVFAYPAFRHTSADWYDSIDIRPYSDYLYRQGFTLFGFTYDAKMDAARWYLPNMSFREKDTLDMYGHERSDGK